MSDYFTSGFSVREPMWHGKGNVLAEPPKDWAEARKLAGLEWDPVPVPVFVQNPAGEMVQASQFTGVARNDTGEILTIRSDQYRVIDNGALGTIIEAILEQPNVEYVTAGAARDGKEVWVLAMLDEPVTIPGDNSLTLPFLAVTNQLDGTGACRANSTSIKVVCHNTFAASEAEGTRNGTIFTFPHRGNYEDRIEEARQTIKGLRVDFAKYVEVAGDLLKVRVNGKQRELFVREFIPMPPDGLVSDRVVANVETARSALRAIMASPTADGIGDTAWGLVQSAGEYLDHYRQARTLDSKYRRSLLRPEPLKARAVTLARQVVTV